MQAFLAMTHHHVSDDPAESSRLMLSCRAVPPVAATASPALPAQEEDAAGITAPSKCSVSDGLLADADSDRPELDPQRQGLPSPQRQAAGDLPAGLPNLHPAADGGNGETMARSGGQPNLRLDGTDAAQHTPPAAAAVILRRRIILPGGSGGGGSGSCCGSWDNGVHTLRGIIGTGGGGHFAADQVVEPLDAAAAAVGGSNAAAAVPVGPLLPADEALDERQLLDDTWLHTLDGLDELLESLDEDLREDFDRHVPTIASAAAALPLAVADFGWLAAPTAIMLDSAESAAGRMPVIVDVTAPPDQRRRRASLAAVNIRAPIN